MHQIVAEEVPDIWYTRNRHGYPHQEELKDVALTTTYALWDRMWLED